MSSPEHKQFIWNLIKDVKIGMLTTESEDKNDSLRARPMSLVQDAYDGTLYFFTSRSAEKVDEIKNDKEVGVTFSDPSKSIFVSLSGKARITQDKELINKYWSEGVAAWFPDGKDNKDVAIMEVKIYKGEHWKTDENKLVQLFELAKANVLEESPDIGENEKF